jgi:hypothetical protein
MAEYTQRFVENRIDLSVLPDLTDQHLEKLGVAPGDRLKILRAIRELSGTAMAATLAAAAVAPVVQDSAERRQLTVMFCDLVGSTALSGRLDPEDLRGIIGAYHRCCAQLVERNGGFVAKYIGDGVLAYFGYPQAHEHDAERAVRAGLALVEGVPKLTTAAGFLSLLKTPKRQESGCSRRRSATTGRPSQAQVPVQKLINAANATDFRLCRRSTFADDHLFVRHCFPPLIPPS